ncbi:SpoIIE family protein phosphatase [Streptomyces sp. DSM 44917]|uniref:SpoIIE family protein phosphatase n=1 Tax=Streptomyces boetiae TaxID=3075541 RepID=A0ABU2L6X8_9ACTN|nr:SpoIIE family protein phosphatase [Streptomyces sp. DSM 44917]MDT0307323.1 SpoIIE family protein phosphatase [Streptomyces sp. DSM 44917]
MAEDAGALSGERRADRRARYMEELTDALARAVTTTDVLTAVAEHVLPPFEATGEVVYSVADDQWRLVGVVGYSDEFVARLKRQDETGGPSDILLLDHPQFAENPAQFLKLWPQREELVRISEKGAWAILPLFAAGRRVGTCAVSWPRPHSFDAEQRSLLGTFSGLVAQALERARLYDDEHLRAERLQAALLPRVLRPLPALTAVARHRGENGGADAGGHLCDVMRLPAERAALVVGAARAGGGLDEAIIMGRLRTAVTTLTALDYQPDEMLLHLHDAVGAFAGDLGEGAVITCLYAVYDPSSGTCSVASAGHQPPALARDGAFEILPVAVGPPLGAEQPAYERSEFELAAGVPLLLHTAPGDVLTADWTRLEAVGAAVASFHAGPPPADGDEGAGGDEEMARLEGLAADVAAALPVEPSRLASAAAVMAVLPRRLAPGTVAEWRLPYEPEAAGQARDRVREQLTAWGAEELVTGTELIVSELVGNAIRYAAPLRGDALRLRLLRAATVTCELADGSESSPRIRHPALLDETGRGLQLVAAVAHQWGARFTDSGKVIWAEQLLP